MNSVVLGGDLTIGRMGFGAMRITGPGIWGWPTDRTGMVALLHRVRELGISFIDTADSYGPETSEYLIEQALYPYEGLIVATKGGLERSGPGEWKANCHPDHLKIACENSLRRLRVERIDLYQLHTVNSRYPLEDSIGMLALLQREGKIRHIGVSNFDSQQLALARAEVDIVSVQNHYNLSRRVGEDVVDACTEHGIVFIPWYPLGAAELTRDRRLQPFAEKYDATVGQIALAWLLRRSPIVVPIPGTSSISHLEENLAAATVELSDDDFEALSALSF